MEGIIKNVQVWGKGCIGCKKFEKDIMLSFMIEGGDKFDIHDIFFTTDQAEHLKEWLTKRLEENKVDGK